MLLAMTSRRPHLADPIDGVEDGHDATVTPPITKSSDVHFEDW